ncbi:MAG: alpha/beta hydrolase [Pseudonocardiaceae bacterium]
MTGYEGEGMPALRDGEAFRVASRSSSWLAAGLTAVAMLTLPGCSPGLTSATAPVHPKENLGAPTPLAPLPQAAPEPLGVIGAAAPRLQWRRCAGSFQCAAATVPLDYNQPHGATITLSVIRLPAADQAHRIGSLFVDFGGPGTGGVGELESLGPRYPDVLRQRFDLVSFDSRGVGGSAPVRCATDSGAGNVPVGSPVRPEQQAMFFASSAALGRSCAATSGELLAHTSSANTARDLELLRQAVGEESLSFLGYSYGTYVGAIYANLFPDRTRAMIFDGALDLVANSTGRPGQEQMPVDVRADTARSQAEELDAFFDRCTQAGPRCAFSAGDPHRKFADLVAKLKKSSDSRLAAVLRTVSHGLQSSTRWSGMATSLQAVYNSIRPDGASAQGQPPTLDPYIPSHSASFLAVQCVDSDYPRDHQEYTRLVPVEDQRQPYFGLTALFDMAQCIAWPITDRDRYSGPWNRRRQHPILVVNNRYDPETPVWNAQATRDELSDAQLLIIDGYGHTTLDVHSACATAAETNYLTTLQLPADGATCSADYQPFP